MPSNGRQRLQRDVCHFSSLRNRFFPLHLYWLWLKWLFKLWPMKEGTFISFLQWVKAAWLLDFAMAYKWSTLLLILVVAPSEMVINYHCGGGGVDSGNNRSTPWHCNPQLSATLLKWLLLCYIMIMMNTFFRPVPGYFPPPKHFQWKGKIFTLLINYCWICRTGFYGETVVESFTVSPLNAPIFRS